MRAPRQLLTATLLVSLAVSCGTSSQRTPGKLAVSAGDHQSPADAATLTFSAGLVGWTQTRELILLNTGGEPLVVAGFEVLEGHIVVSPDQGVFQFEQLDLNFALSPLEQRTLRVRHQTPSGGAPVPDARARFTADVGDGKSSTVEVTLTAASSSCSCPALSDFQIGAGVRGVIASVPLVLAHPGGTATADVRLGALTGFDPGSFKVAADAGAFLLQPGETVELPIEYKFEANRDYLAYLPITIGCCGERLLALRGYGVDQILSWYQEGADGVRRSLCDFGYVTPGGTASRELTFTNESVREVELRQLKYSTNEFKVPGADAGVFVVSGNTDQWTGPTESKLRVSFSPTLYGPRTATLSFTTPLPTQPTGTMSCTGHGGGPVVELTPPLLDFGVLTYPSSVASHKRGVDVRNVGAPPNGDPRADLHLMPPTVVSVTAGTDEISVALSNYDASAGIAGGTDAGATVDVTVTPDSVGLKEWEISLPTNDQDQPVVRVRVKAEVRSP